ncbi:MULTISPECIES: hypothetical protein [unclassified Bartonella]|uniref:hypothetical protein n=3 Tax=Bartonella TaxID=773 RepID=UPI0035CF14F1
MSSNEILIAGLVVLGALLVCGAMLRVVFYYRNKVKVLKEQVLTLKSSIKTLDEEYAWSRSASSKDVAKRTSDLNIAIKERDRAIKELQQRTEEHEKAFRDVSEVVMALKADVQSRDEEIERLRQELKQREGAVKTPPHKKKRK